MYIFIAYYHNFDILSTDYLDSMNYSFDYGSVMMYSANSFALDPSYPTIIVPPNEEIGQRITLSDNDIAEINFMYKCHSKYQIISSVINSWWTNLGFAIYVIYWIYNVSHAAFR